MVVDRGSAGVEAAGEGAAGDWLAVTKTVVVDTLVDGPTSPRVCSVAVLCLLLFGFACGA